MHYKLANSSQYTLYVSLNTLSIYNKTKNCIKILLQSSSFRLQSSGKSFLIPNEVIKDLFEDVIRCRNRLAHNAYVNISVRNDLPELCNRKELDRANNEK